MTSVGKILRSAREQQNRGLAEIAEELCITQRYLRAIESDDLENLPGAFFYKSFARQYAVLVGISEKTLQPLLDASVPVEEPPPVVQSRSGSSWNAAMSAAADRLGFAGSVSNPAPVRQPDRLLREQNAYLFDKRIGLSVATFAVVLLVCSGFYAWWAERPQVSGNPTPVAAAPKPEPVTLAPVTLAQDESSTQVVTVPTDPGVDGVGHAILNLSATEKTWLSITSDGKVIFSGMLQASETKTLTGVEGAQMKVGNAGGIEVRWKGKQVGPIGPRGQVRTVLLKSDEVEILDSTSTPLQPSTL